MLHISKTPVRLMEVHADGRLVRAEFGEDSGWAVAPLFASADRAHTFLVAQGPTDKTYCVIPATVQVSA